MLKETTLELSGCCGRKQVTPEMAARIARNLVVETASCGDNYPNIRITDNCLEWHGFTTQGRWVRVEREFSGWYVNYFTATGQSSRLIMGLTKEVGPDLSWQGVMALDIELNPEAA